MERTIDAKVRCLHQIFKPKTDLNNVKITRAWNLNAVFADGGSGNWYNVVWKSGSDFSNMKGAIKTDANSYASYFANVGVKGIETITLIDEAKGMKNDSTISGTSVKDALDLVQSRTSTTKGGAWASVPVIDLFDGKSYFDTGLKKPFYYNSGDTSWYDATGTIHP